jgi:nucleoside-diphosphate-sugar epimerase
MPDDRLTPSDPMGNHFSKIIITGGSGFIGTNLVEHFAKKGWEVLNVDIKPPRNPEHQRFWKNVDILDRDLIRYTVADFQPAALLHFAARTDLDGKSNLGEYAANIDGVCNMIDAIRKTSSIQRVVFASSQLVCQLGYQPKNEYDYRPSTLYGQSKVLTERIIRVAGEIAPVWTIVRPTSIWGPWFDVPYKNFFLAIAKNSYMHAGQATTLKQWGFVGNTVYQVEKLLTAAGKTIHGKTFYMADYPPHNLRDFANQVQEAMDAKPIPTVPANFLKTAAMIGDVLKKLGWKNPPLTSFRYHNIITSEIQNLEPLQQIVGDLPYSIEKGVEITTNWLKIHSLQERQ